MNEYRNFCEFSKKNDDSPRSKTLRIVLMSVYTVFTLVYVVLFYLMLKQWQLLILLPFILYGLIALTWHFTKPEYEYSIAGGELSISVIYGGRSRKIKFSGDLTKATRISAFERNIADSRDIASVKDYSAGGEVWSAVFPEDGRKMLVVFSVDDRMKHALKICNPSAVV